LYKPPLILSVNVLQNEKDNISGMKLYRMFKCFEKKQGCFRLFKLDLFKITDFQYFDILSQVRMKKTTNISHSKGI